MRGARVLVREGTFALLSDSGDIVGRRTASPPSSHSGPGGQGGGPTTGPGSVIAGDPSDLTASQHSADDSAPPRGGGSPDGLFLRDARHLSRWQLTVDGRSPAVLSHDDGSSVLTVAATRDAPPEWTLFRAQAVARGALAERVCLRNNGAQPLTVCLALTVDADFADQYELRADDRVYAKPGARRAVRELPDGLAFDYRRGADWSSRTTVTADPAPDARRPVGVGEGDTAHLLQWWLKVPAHGTAVVHLMARAYAPGAPDPAAPATPAALAAQEAADLASFTTDVVVPGTREVTPDSRQLARACEQSLADLARLRVTASGPDGEPVRVPAAGVPWFLGLFGRDSLLTSYFALPYRPRLASATLRALAATQGTRYDPSRLEQPGRIVHEIRHGELAHFRQVPYGRYYGSVDATPLFLVLLQAHAEATGDPSLVHRLRPHARRAVEWLLGDGGLEEHGWLVYSSDAEAGGLEHQNWKDSSGAICFRDGTPAAGPFAVAEVQGYAYDALVRTARLARGPWSDPRYAARLEAVAADLRDRFHRHFWMAEAGFPALALDGRGRQVDALASDAGHLLWSGLLDAEHAARTASRLLRPDLFSGWGVRTLAAGQVPYHPLSYHRGSVWPHDNAVIALGLARSGQRDAVRVLARGLIAAAAAHDWRLPEVMAGYDREEHPSPVPYPHSCSPQAWAAATPLALLTALRTGGA